MSEDPEITDPRDPYKRPDIVTELDAHIHDASNSVDYVIEWRRTLLIGLLQRARDEIVALREMREAEFRMLSTNRDEVLEEAARIAQNGCLVPPDGGSPTEEEREMCKSIAAAIRKLKDRRA